MARAHPLGSQRAGRAAVAVLIVDPWPRRPVCPASLQRLLGLTPTEARVAARLAEGKTVPQIAARTHCESSTVRWHLRQIYSKTCCSHQGDLIRLVLAVSRLPVAPEAGG